MASGGGVDRIDTSGAEFQVDDVFTRCELHWSYFPSIEIGGSGGTAEGLSLPECKHILRGNCRA